MRVLDRPAGWLLIAWCCFQFGEVASAWQQPAVTVELLAGDWLAGESDQQASGYSMNRPFGAAVDQTGTLHVVELEGGRVHRLPFGGEWTRVGGNGEKGYLGDGGPLSQAVFDGMHNVAATPQGDLYIADTWNHCVRRVDAASGVISTIAGDGQPGFSGDGGPAKQARFNYVMCVSLNPQGDRLCITDLKNHRVRVLDLATGTVETVAGNGQAGRPKDGSPAREAPLADPRAAVMDAEGRLYILERGGHALRLVDQDGAIRTVAGTGRQGSRDGAALEAEFNAPKHLCLDPDGRVLIADEGNGLIRCYDPHKQQVSTVLGDRRSSPPVTLKQPHGVCWNHGQLYVLDSGNHRVLRIPWPTDGFADLFPGGSLDQWRIVNTAESTWTWRDGVLHCSGKPIGELRTRKMHHNFILELEWRHLVPRGNAGVFVWADDITAKGVPFHRGVEVQVLENEYGDTRSHTTHGDIFPIHGAVMTPVLGRGGSRAFPFEFRSRPSPQWNHYRITCLDGEISLAVNGKLVTRGFHASPRRGYICLESEGGVVEYRNVRLKELPGDAPPAEQTATVERGYQSLYDGLSLQGWSVVAGETGDWTAQDWILQYRADAQAPPDADWRRRGLRTDAVRQSYDFLLDVKPLGAAGEVRLLPHGQQGLQLRVGETDGPQTLRSGVWRRIEGQVRDGVLRVAIDGRGLPDIALPGAGTGPLTIASDVDCDFANLYVK